MDNARRICTFFLLVLPLILFGPALIGARAFVPADLLKHVAPWETPEKSTAWNVLRFDGAAQFYPWRLEVGRQWRAGRLPLVNPNAFAASGGTPLWANSQSAPLYPGNVLFWLLPEKHLWWAFGASAALHLLLAAVGIYRLARSLGVSREGASLSAATFALSGPIVCWLALPTFLCVAAYLPWMLLFVRRAILRREGRALLLAGLCGGLAILGGHLQIAFYVIAAALLWAAAHLPGAGVKPARAALGALGALALAGLLAAPQALPSVELSRSSHRAGAARPSVEGYRAYVKAALPPRQLVTLLVPEFYGHPGDGTHWADSDRGGNNFAEWAAYVGCAPLLLAMAALFLPWKKAPPGLLSERRAPAALLLFSLALALGTPLCALLYFGLPGFSQTGSPARALFVAALALALLAGIGLDSLRDGALSDAVRKRAIGAALAACLLLGAIGAAGSAGWAAKAAPGVAFGNLMALALPFLALGALALGLGLALALSLTGRSAAMAAPLLPLLAAIELLRVGIGYNPTSSPADVYPPTPGLRWLQQRAVGKIVAPLNARWSLGAASPKAVLPPNTLTVYGLRDIAGYDSLFLSSSKERFLRADDGRDPCPPENGNMVFVKGPEIARALGADFIVTRPDAPPLAGFSTPVYDGPDLRIYAVENPTAPAPEAPPGPTLALKVGLFLGALGLATLGFFACVFCPGSKPGDLSAHTRVGGSTDGTCP